MQNMGFRFLHTADWQVGKPFGHVPGDAGAALRQQRIGTVETLARLAAEHAVDAVLVAGDAFDSNAVEDRTLYRLVKALKPFAGRWIFLPGNHDAALAHSVWTRLRTMGLPDNVTIADRPEPVTGWEGRATILPAPLTRRHESLDQTEWFDTAESADGAVRIGLAHGSVANRLPGDAEARNAIAETRAESAGLAYLALGDWHGALEIAPRTFYSGTPETDRHRANASGHALLVEIGGPAAPPRVTSLPTSHYLWHALDLPLGEDGAAATARAIEALGRDASRLVVSLKLSGALSLAERHALATGIEGWRARLHHLDLDDMGLIEAPSLDDLDAIDTGGFVRLAVDRLKARAGDPADPEAEAARLALRLLYFDHMSGARK